jgi:hypothetical protein
MKQEQKKEYVTPEIKVVKLECPVTLVQPSSLNVIIDD